MHNDVTIGFTDSFIAYHHYSSNASSKLTSHAHGPSIVPHWSLSACVNVGPVCSYCSCGGTQVNCYNKALTDVPCGISTTTTVLFDPILHLYDIQTSKTRPRCFRKSFELNLWPTLLTQIFRLEFNFAELPFPKSLLCCLQLFVLSFVAYGPRILARLMTRQRARLQY